MIEVYMFACPGRQILGYHVDKPQPLPFKSVKIRRWSFITAIETVFLSKAHKKHGTK
jgi:hypothetical protein